MKPFCACLTECSNGKYGQNCSKPCGNCAGSPQCEASFGACEWGCKTGYTGTHCLTGRYSLNKGINWIISVVVAPDKWIVRIDKSRCSNLCMIHRYTRVLQQQHSHICTGIYRRAATFRDEGWFFCVWINTALTYVYKDVLSSNTQPLSLDIVQSNADCFRL